MRFFRLMLRHACVPALLMLFSVQSWAGTWNAFGPQVYQQTTTIPKGVTSTFTVQSTATNYTLVMTGTADANPLVTLNGKNIVDSGDPNVTKPVSLALSNTITVTVRGGVGKSVTVKITGVDNDLPAITTAASPATNSAGWNNGNVVVTFTCSDKTSGVASCTAPVTVSADGANQVIKGTATDLAGNTASTSITINLDKTAPNIAPAQTPAADSFGWNNTAVTVSFTCSDATSGLVSCTGPTTLSAEGANQVVKGTTTDKAGNSASATDTVNIDKTAPTISSTATPAANAAGWNNSNVTVAFTCSDSLSGVATCPAAAAVSTEGAKQSISGTATDKAGNNASTSRSLNIDKTRPAVTTALSPVPNAAGWNNSNVTASFTCSDTLSGVASCPPTTTITTEGANQIPPGTASDVAGNTANPDRKVNLDKTPPAIAASLSPPANSFGWNNTNVTITFACSDALSGVASCSAPASFTAEGAAQTASGTTTDRAGNTANTTATVRIDKTPPAITAAIVPAADARGIVTLPASGFVTVTFTCSDSLSGIASCPPAIQVSTPGVNQAFSGTAADKAGNAANANVTFSVQSAPLAVTASVAPAANANGWNNTAVSVSYQCTGGVPPVQCPAAQTVSAEGANQLISATATDAAGQTATASTTLNIDETAPIITAAVSPAADAQGIVTLPASGFATVTFTCSDALSGIASCPAAIQVSTPAANQSFSGTASDKAGNTANASVTFSMQSAPLAVTASIAPPPNANGWNNSAVTVSYQCTGGVPPVQCPAAQIVSAEGANQVISATATDAASQTATASTTLNIDLTPPVISATVSPTPAANGIINATSATVSFTCSDSLSGIFTCRSPVTVTTTGFQTISGTAVDKAGNTSSANIQFTLQPFPPLRITASASPPPNAAGWNNTPVTVSFQCTGGAPPVSCPASQTVNTDGANQVITGTATDAFGGTATASATINLDQTPPLVAVTSPSDGGISPSASVSVTGLASDQVSGLAAVSCNSMPATISSGSFSCSLQVTQGSLVVSIQATDIAGNSATTNIAVSLQGPKLVITSPAPLDLFGSKSITVNGTVDDPNVVVTVNGVHATINGGTFTAQGVILREGSNVVTAIATNAGGAVGTTGVNVVLDTTPPIVTIDSPSDHALLTSSQVYVTGMVNDVVPGTVNSAQISVTINGVKAEVTNRSFMAEDILLVPGKNVITATATDRAGNTSQSSITITLLDAANQQRILMVAGNGQSGAIGATLPEPLVVEVVNATGQPLAGVPVTFSLVKGDGQLTAFPQQARQITIQTDGNGEAGTAQQLGTRVGSGNNQVLVTSPGFVGQIMFCSTATAGPPAQIHDIAGESQKGVVGQSLPQPFTVVVFDAGGNPVNGVPVVFKVEQGGGTLEGSTTVTKTTDSDGRASAVLVLAQEEGINNNVVSASFTGFTGAPANFIASGVTPRNPTNTTVTGIVLDNANTPVVNVTASIQGTNLKTLTDKNGEFTIPNAPVGSIELFIDGSTSTQDEPYPFLEFPIVTVAGQDNHLPSPIFLPELDLDNSKLVGGDEDVTLTMKGVPGVVFTVLAHSATFPDGSHVGKLSVSQVHSDKVPMPPPNATTPHLFWTVQPPRVKFNPPMRIQIPNTDGLPAGTVTEIFCYNHDLEEFASGGTARVNEDGSFIVSDIGSGVIVSGWGGAPPPSPPQAPCPSSCDDHNACTADSCSNGVCQNKPLNVTLKVTAPPDKPNPNDNDFANNFTFLSDTQITGTASLTGGGDPNEILWTVTGIRGGIKNPTPANRKGPTFTFTPDPPAHTAGGSNGRSLPLGFTLRVEVCSKSDQHVIKQDTRDIIRQEYKNHGITIPGRGEFNNSAATTHFSAGVINRTAYAPLILGNPGDLAENIRTQYNTLLNGDQQVVAPGTQHLPVNAVIVRASATSFAVIGRKLITPPCYPNPRNSCDDAIGPDGFTILAGADGTAQTTVLSGDFGLVLNSTWRNPERNEAAGGVKTSRHQYGNAVDMSPSDASVGLLNTHPGLYCVLKTAASNTANFAQAENGPAHPVPCNQADVNHVHGQNN